MYGSNDEFSSGNLRKPLPMTESGKLLNRFMEFQGFNLQSIEAYDNWVNETAISNVSGRILTMKDGKCVVFPSLSIFPPKYTRDGETFPLTPKLAREQQVTYGSDWHVDVELRESVNGRVFEKRAGVCIGTVPTMVGSIKCNIRNKNPRDLALLGEDPEDPKGYFIIKGVEKTILLQELLMINKIFLMDMGGKTGKVARMTVNTPRGTSLIEIILDKKNRSVFKMRFPSMKNQRQPSKKSGKPEQKYKSLNVLRIYRLLGISNIDEIEALISMFIKPERLARSMEELSNTKIQFLSSLDDVDIIAAKIGKSELSIEEKRAEINKILDNDLFPHVDNLQGVDGERDSQRRSRIRYSKIYLLSIMIARFLEHKAGYRDLDNRDSWSNKRVQGAGRLMEQLFRNIWRKILSTVQGEIDDGNITTLDGVVEKLRTSLVTDTFHDSFITSNWGVKGTHPKNNIAQTLYRDSVPATHAHLATVDVAVSRTDKSQGPRLVDGSQYGFIDSVSTPEGENAGILKNLCMTAKVSVEKSDNQIIAYLIGDEANGFRNFVSQSPDNPLGRSDKIMVNGKFLGWCSVVETYDHLIYLRRAAELPYDMSVIKEDDWLYVDLSPSRLLRPLLIVNEEQKLLIDVVGARDDPDQIFDDPGVVEYVSPWEQEYIKVAPSVDYIKNRLLLFEDAKKAVELAKANLLAVEDGKQIFVDNVGDAPAQVATYKTDEKLGIRVKVLSKQEDQSKIASVLLTKTEAMKVYDNALNDYKKLKETNRPYTHCELDSKAILGIASGLIPYIDSNQAPRNTYQVGMGKQALGDFHGNHLNRMGDGTTKTLVYTNRPMVETDLYSVIGLDDKGPGQNCKVAFQAVPYTEEDSFAIKKEFIDSGGFRIFKYLTYKTQVRLSGDSHEILDKPMLKSGEPEDRYKYIQKRETGNPNNGLPMIGAYLKAGDCVIGKIQHIPATREIRNESVILRVGDEGVVEKVLVTSDNKTTTVTVKLRIMRVPQEGDKFAPRNAQKGTVGIVISEIYMAHNESGISPDIIANSHCFAPDTHVLLKNGMSRRLIDTKYNGGNKVWSWDPETSTFIESKTIGYESKGIKEVMTLTLSDGRSIRCTPDHRIPVLQSVDGKSVYNRVHVKDVDSTMRIYAGMDGVLDCPTEEESMIEKEWVLQIGDYSFSMGTPDNRDKALAFARLLGLICADGCVSESKSGHMRASICIGTIIDADTVLDDLELITGTRPAVTPHFSEKGGNTLSVNLGVKFATALSVINGMSVGRRTIQTQQWPEFLSRENCPKSIIREFLGGLFGGDGWCPYLVTNKQDGQGTVTFNPPAISQSACLELSDELVHKMTIIANLLEKVGVSGARVDNPKHYNFGNKDMVTCIVQLPRGTEFGDKVGFRYCVQKMYRMSAYQSYMRYLSNVKRQNDYIVRRASEIYDNKEGVRSLNDALIKARKELFATEAPFNEYYSNATLDQVKNRRRKNRFNELVKWDYTRIEDADKYLHKIGAYHWFRTEEGKGGADYIIKQHDTNMPYFLLDFHSKRITSTEEVFDIGIAITHTLSAQGVAICNCLPSRMTLSYVKEIHDAKTGAMKCEHVNASAFSNFDLDGNRATLSKYGLDPLGDEIFYSGTSGLQLANPIYSGPVFFQALKHHVKDKTQVRSTGQVKPTTRQPPKGRGNKGGLRFGEMERDAVISHGCSSFLMERLMLVSDGYPTVFCGTCGCFAVVDTSNEWYKPCRLCGDTENFGRRTIPYAYKFLVHLLSAISINLRPGFITPDEYISDLFTKNRKNTSTLDDIVKDVIESETFNNEEMIEDAFEEEFDEPIYGNID